MTQLENLKVFLEVAHFRNFSLAARHLNMPKSTVSRRIKELEEDLKVKLINRDQRNFELTNSGHILLSKGETAWEEVEKVFDEVRSEDAGLQGQITISTTVEFAKLFLSEPLASFCMENPQLKIKVDVNPTQVDLIADKVDLAIRVGPLNDSALFAKKITERTPGIYASAKYLKKFGTPNSLAELSQHSIISPGPRKILGTLIEPSLRANNMSFILDLTTRGVGIGLMDSSVATEHVKKGELITLFPQLKLEKTPIFMVYQQKSPPKRVRLLMDKILHQFK